MKLELNEIESINNENSHKLFTNFKSFNDILICFERQNNSFLQIEKELLVSSPSQIMFIFSFLLFIHFSFAFTSIILKLSISYFFQNFIKKNKFDLSFSQFIYSSLSFLSKNFKNNYCKVQIYHEEKRKFLNDFFSITVNKEIILSYLYNFYHENEYLLSSHIYSEIDSIKIAIENENYESAFEKILAFKKRVIYIKEFHNIS